MIPRAILTREGVCIVGLRRSRHLPFDAVFLVLTFRPTATPAITISTQYPEIYIVRLASYGSDQTNITSSLPVVPPALERSNASSKEQLLAGKHFPQVVHLTVFLCSSTFQRCTSKLFSGIREADRYRTSIASEAVSLLLRTIASQQAAIAQEAP